MTGDVLPLSVPATHKPTRRIHFPHTYVASSIFRHGVDNEALLFTVTAEAYRVMQRMFLPMLGLPMRPIANLCTFRMR